jgi:hypothetical protein
MYQLAFESALNSLLVDIYRFRATRLKTWHARTTMSYSSTATPKLEAMLLLNLRIYRFIKLRATSSFL